jgi:2-methylcitrate dehydratase PrpD
MSRRGLLGATLLGTGLGALTPSASWATAAPSPARSQEGPTGQRDAIEEFADHILLTPYEAIPASALAMTRRQLEDTLAVALAARNEPGARDLLALAEEIGGRQEAAFWGSRLRGPAHEVARASAVMAHALEYDDTFEPGYLHPSAITFPAALAAAELAGGVSGREFVAATTLAIDMACRLSIAGQPGVDGFTVGWHYTTLLGYVTSALAAARLLRLTPEQAVSAAGIAAHQAAGTAQSHIDAALSKRLGPGFACASGVFAARLAARGVTGPRRVLEGDRGFFRQYHAGRYSRELLLDGLGVRYPAEETSFKPWPSCRGSHTSVEAALRLVQEGRLRAHDIDRITIFNAPSEWPLLSQPLETKRSPRSTVEAQFSIPWAVAAVLVDARLSLAHFTPEALQRDDLLQMASRIDTQEDQSLANPRGGPGFARIEIVTRERGALEMTAREAKGSPGSPMSAQDAQSKFDDCIAFAGLPRRFGERLQRRIREVEALDDVACLSAALRAPSA